jgi:MFS family permease
VRRPRSLATTLHAVLFIASATQTALVPLLPALARLHHLSGATSGLLIALPGLATLAISAPAGVIADRFGARRVTVAATLLLAAGACAQGLLSVGALIAGRLLFGLAYGIVWTTATAWLAASQDGGGDASLGAVATSSAAGMAAGPGIGGLAAQLVGLAAPFLMTGAAACLAAGILARQVSAGTPVSDVRGSLRALAVQAPRHPGVLAGAVALGVVGAVGGVTQLLIPLDLHRVGISTAATGALFSAAAGFYVLVSGGVTRLGGRLISVGTAALATLALSLSLLPASVARSPTVLIAVLFLSTAPRAMISTIAYPLATHSASEGAALADGKVIGLLNAVWAVGLVLAPMLAGALAGADWPGGGYLVAVVPGVFAAVWLISRGSGRRRWSPAALRS